MLQREPGILADTMHVDVIDNYAEFTALRSEWDAVYSADPEAQFFLSWIWLSQLFLRRPESWSVLAARTSDDQKDYVAFLPLRQDTRFSKSRKRYINEIYMGGNFWADYTGLICHPDHDESAIPALVNRLREMNWAVTNFENIFASDRRLAMLTEQFPGEEFRISPRNRTSKFDGIDNLVSPYVKLPESYEKYLQSNLSANTRQKIRRYQRKLETAEDLHIRRSTAATRNQDLDALVHYWREAWTDRMGRKVGTLARKYREIVEQGLEADFVFMPVLVADGRPVAVVASFVDRVKKCLLFYVAGRDRSWATLPPGLLLHAHSIRWAIHNGFRTYDMLRGDEQYKYSLGAEDRLIACIRVETRDGRNLHGKLDRNSREFILKDIGHRLERSDSGSARTICTKILSTWPDDEHVLRLCENSLLQAGHDQAAQTFRARLLQVQPAVPDGIVRSRRGGSATACQRRPKPADSGRNRRATARRGPALHGGAASRSRAR